MIHAQNTKEVVLIKPVSITTDGASGTVDTLGYDYAVIRVVLNTAATNSPLVALAVSDGPASNSFTAITSLTGGTNAGNFTIAAPAGTGATGEINKFYLDLRRRKRFLKVDIDPTAARIGTITCELSRAEVAPDTAAGRGLLMQVIE
jgi:hypothetical protein